MGRKTPERMYEQTGMNQDMRDQMIWTLRRRGMTYRRIANRLGVSVGAVQGSLRRTQEKLAGLR
jgi:transposase